MQTKANTTEPDAKSPKPLLGRVALVTGGSRGLGAAIGRELADAGATTIVNYNHGTEPARRIVDQIQAAGGKAFAEQCNVADYDDVERMFGRIKERCGRLDILVNNAAIVRDHSFRKMTAQEWREVIDTDSLGCRTKPLLYELTVSLGRFFRESLKYRFPASLWALRW